MRRISYGVLCAGLIGLLAAPAALAQLGELTDREIFQRKLARYAPEQGKRPKGLCVCQDGSANHGRAGQLHQEEVLQLRVTCMIPTFTGSGGSAGFGTCGTFESLGR